MIEFRTYVPSVRSIIVAEPKPTNRPDPLAAALGDDQVEIHRAGMPPVRISRAALDTLFEPDPLDVRTELRFKPRGGTP